MDRPEESRGDAGLGTVATAWALVGPALLFLFAIYRLGKRGVATVQEGLAGWEWGILLALTVAFVVGEGIGALQERWVPRLVERASQLRHGGGVLHRLLAPLYGMSLIGAPPARMVRSWALTLGIVVMVLIVRAFPEPWRGITDLAVAAALLWGLGAIVVRAPEAFRS